MYNLRRIALAGAASVLLAGCGTTFSDLPVPGKNVGGPTYRVTVQFDDALNLPVGAGVKIGGVLVGKVQKVTVGNFKAVAIMDIKKDIVIHEGATFRLRATTPLGELFINIVDSDSGAPLKDGAQIGTDHSSTAATIEDSLAATSVLLNGGSLSDLSTLIRETNKMLDGRQDKTRDVLSKANAVVAQLGDSTKDITDALTALADVSKILNGRESTITNALTQLRPAAQVLTQNTGKLNDLLTKVNGLSATARSVIAQTRSQLLLVSQQLAPVLATFAKAGDVLDAQVKAVVDASKFLQGPIPGDYLNLGANIHLDAVIGGGGLNVLGNLLGGQSATAVPLSTVGSNSIPTIPGASSTSSQKGGAK